MKYGRIYINFETVPIIGNLLLELFRIRTHKQKYNIPMYKAIEVSCPMTKRKSSLVVHVLKLYRKTAEIIANFQWSSFFKPGSFNRKAKLEIVPVL